MESSDIYQAPTTEPAEPEQEAAHALYVVSPGKFNLLYLTTLGIYEVYWQYRNWQQLKTQRGLKVRPVPRALFSLFFFASLLKHINTELGEKHSARQLPVVPMTTLYVAVAIVSQLADRLAAKMETYSTLDFISLVLLPVTWLILLSTQKAINLSQGDSDGQSNTSITWANGAWMFLGLLLWLAIIAGISTYVAPEVWE